MTPKTLALVLAAGLIAGTAFTYNFKVTGTVVLVWAAAVMVDAVCEAIREGRGR